MTTKALRHDADLQTLTRVLDMAPAGETSLYERFCRHGREVPEHEFTQLRLLAVATGLLEIHSFTLPTIAIQDFADRVAALPERRDGAAFLRMFRECAPDTVRDEDIDCLRTLALQVHDHVRPGPDVYGFALFCVHCHKSICLRDAFLFQAKTCRCEGGGAALIVAREDQSESDESESESNAKEMRVLALLEWWASMASDLSDAADASWLPGSAPDAPPSTCDLCGTTCVKCGSSRGTTELIHLGTGTRGYHCSECGWLLAEFPYTKDLHAASLGECPRCARPDRISPDRLIECVNGHHESENKFLLAAMHGLRGFWCATCRTPRFRMGGDYEQ